MAEMRNQDTLEEAVSALALRGMNVSIYNSSGLTGLDRKRAVVRC